MAADEPIVEAFDDSLLQAMLDESAMQFDVVESDEVAEIDEVVELATVDIDYAEIEEFEADGFAAEEFSGEFDSPFGDALDLSSPNRMTTSRSLEFGRRAPSGPRRSTAPCDADDEFFVMWPSGADDVTPSSRQPPDVAEMPAPSWSRSCRASIQLLVTEPVEAELTETWPAAVR